MDAFINIPKRQGSSVCTRNGAILEAISAPVVKSIVPCWKLEGDGSEVDCMLAARDLRGRLQETRDELRTKPHHSFAELERSGLFSWLEVSERRGFWRVECVLSPDDDNAEAKMARVSADNHSNFGTL
jgi:hypothetical protein